MPPCWVFEVSEEQRYRLGLLLVVFNIIAASVAVMTVIPYWHLTERLLLLQHVTRYGPDCLRAILLVCIVVFLLLHVTGARLSWNAAFYHNRHSAADALPVWLLFILSFLWLAPMATVLSIAQQRPLVISLGRELTVALREYKSHALTRLAVDRLQMELRCCGDLNYTDWLTIHWLDKPPLDAESSKLWLFEDAVPFSCCDPSFVGPCLRHKPRKVNRISRLVASTFYNRGCREAVQNDVSRALRFVTIAQISNFFLQLGIIVLTKYLVTSISTSYLLGNPLLPSLGWLMDSFGTLKDELVVRAEEAQDRLEAKRIAAAWKKVENQWIDEFPAPKIKKKRPKSPCYAKEKLRKAKSKFSKRLAEKIEIERFKQSRENCFATCDVKDDNLYLVCGADPKSKSLTKDRMSAGEINKNRFRRQKN